ncbi:unnamed protein product [Acidithrix sp. C25]|nr:unnamed protein product [Acidithrix sp. C25]
MEWPKVSDLTCHWSVFNFFSVFGALGKLSMRIEVSYSDMGHG